MADSNGVELSEYLELAAAARRAHISENSRRQYENYAVRIMRFFCKFYPTLVSDSFKSGVADMNDGPTPEYVRSIFCPPVNLENPPLLFTQIKAEQFSAFVLSMKKADGRELSFSSMNCFRASLTHLYREFSVEMPQDLRLKMGEHFRGIKRKKAIDAQAGNTSVKTGKDPLDFSLYIWFCSKFLKIEKAEGIFAWCALTISWNLMCRVSNSMSICFEHFVVSQDAIGIFFAHTKNDQAGEQPRDPRHVYANPVAG